MFLKMCAYCPIRTSTKDRLQSDLNVVIIIKDNIKMAQRFDTDNFSFKGFNDVVFHLISMSGQMGWFVNEDYKGEILFEVNFEKCKHKKWCVFVQLKVYFVQ